MEQASQKYNEMLLRALSKNNELRKQAEKEVDIEKEQKTNLFIQILCQFLQSSPNEQIRQYAAIFLRKNLSSFNEKRLKNLWPQLNTESQNIVKESLFGALQSEIKQSIRHQICDAIGELGGNLIESENGDQWPTLIQAIWTLLGQNNLQYIESGLNILSSLLNYASDSFLRYKAELYGVFQNGIINTNKNIKIAAMEAFTMWITQVDRSDSRQFQEIMPSLIAETQGLLKSDPDKGQEALQFIQEIGENEPKFLKKSFEQLFLMLYQISFDKSCESGIRRLATEIILNMVECLSELFKATQSRIEKTIEIVFGQMVEIEEEIEQDWMQPPEGYNEDFDEDSEYEVIRFGTAGIDRMIQSLGGPVMLPILSQIVARMFSMQDWRYTHAAIMALSQVGEYVNKPQEIAPIITHVISYKNNANPKIRYSMLHCLGQIADDMDASFQEQFLQQVFPVLIELLKDPVPRVQSHAAAAITNFSENMSQAQMQPYLHSVVQNLFALMTNTCSLVKETALSAIATVAETSQQSFCQYFEEAAPFMFNVLESHHSKEYKQIRGQVVECFTLMAHAVGYEAFAKYQDKLINMMITLQNQPMPPQDPQVSYLLAGWQRLCVIMKKQHFQPYLQVILPSVFKTIQSLLKDTELQQLSEKENPTNDQNEIDKEKNIATSGTEDAEVALAMLQVIMAEMQEDYVQYSENTAQILLPLLHFNTNESLRQIAGKTLPTLLSCIVAKDVEIAKGVSKVFLNALWTAVETEVFPQIMQDHIVSMKDIFTCVETEFLNQGEINTMNEKILKLFEDSEKRKHESNVTSYQTKEGHVEQLEEDEIGELKEDIDSEEDFQIEISQLIGQMLRTHPNLMLSFVETLYTQMIPHNLKDKQSEKQMQLGLFMIDDIVEFLPLNLCTQKLPSLFQTLLQYAQSPYLSLRQAAVYGIGILAEKADSKITNFYTVEVCAQSLNTLNASLNVKQQDEQKPKPYALTQDNVVAAVGKIIKFHSEKVANIELVIQTWYHHLPMRHDKVECMLQHELLLDILSNKPQFLIGASGEHTGKLLIIFATLLQSKQLINDQTNQKICQALERFQKNPQIMTRWPEFVAQLTETQKKAMEDSFVKYQQKLAAQPNNT